MDILPAIKNAVTSYLQFSYPGDLPDRQKALLNTLSHFRTEEEFWNWDFLEREGNRTSMRWGNSWYPHMKLIVRGDVNQDLLFYVDAHDRHFSLPPQFEDRLFKIRNKNMETKRAIEHDLQSKNLRVMDVSLFSKIKFEPLAFPVNVLAVDDEPHILNLIKIFLTKIGANSILCSCVDEAIELLETQEKPHIILCDIMMPEKSGYFFFDWLKDHHFNIPFYFVTGLGKDSVKYQDVPIIQKPFKVCDLNTIVKDHLNSEK